MIWILFLKGGRKKGGETLKENRSYRCVRMCILISKKQKLHKND